MVGVSFLEQPQDVEIHGDNFEQGFSTLRH